MSHPRLCALVISGSPAATDIALIKRLAKQSDFILAVDSGADALIAAELLPDLLLGDFDSIDQETLQFCRAQEVELETHDTNKDATDIELALTRLLSEGYNSIVATKVLGGRIDHELASLACFVRLAQQGVKVAIIETNQTCLFLSSSSELRRLCIDTTTEPMPAIISLIPWASDVNVSIKGVRWELDHETLTLHGTRGLSNVPKADHVDIEIHEGTIIVVLEN